MQILDSTKLIKISSNRLGVFKETLARGKLRYCEIGATYQVTTFCSFTGGVSKFFEIIFWKVIYEHVWTIFIVQMFGGVCWFEWHKGVYFMIWNYYALMIYFMYVLWKFGGLVPHIFLVLHTVIDIVFVWHRYIEYMSSMDEIPCKINRD